MSTLDEQVRELEAKLQAALARAAKWRTLCDQAIADCNAAESRLAQARVEGARAERDAFAKGGMWVRSLAEAYLITPEHIGLKAARRYPAPASGERGGFTGQSATSGTYSPTVCVIPNCSCAHKRTPPSAPESRGPLSFRVVRLDDGEAEVVITRFDARRIVGMGAQADV